MGLVLPGIKGDRCTEDPAGATCVDTYIHTKHETRITKDEPMAHERWTELARNRIRWSKPITAVIFSLMAFFMIALTASTGPRLDRDVVDQPRMIPVTFKLSREIPAAPQQCDANAPWVSVVANNDCR